MPDGATLRAMSAPCQFLDIALQSQLCERCHMNENSLLLSDCAIQSRIDTTTADVVETGIQMADTYGRYDAARYLIMHRVGFHIVARVLADPGARRRTDCS
jgi:hypothetical protein